MHTHQRIRSRRHHRPRHRQEHLPPRRSRQAGRNRDVSRNQLLRRLVNLPACLLGLEARPGSGSHHIARQIQPLGHDVRLIPAQYVKPFLKGHKNDFRDAEAIAEAVQRPNDAACQRLMTVPGIGPIISSAVVAAIGTGSGFKQGRDFAAWLGFVPKQESPRSVVQGPSGVRECALLGT